MYRAFLSVRDLTKGWGRQLVSTEQRNTLVQALLIAVLDHGERFNIHTEHAFSICVYTYFIAKQIARVLLNRAGPGLVPVNTMLYGVTTYCPFGKMHLRKTRGGLDVAR